MLLAVGVGALVVALVAGAWLLPDGGRPAPDAAVATACHRFDAAWVNFEEGTAGLAKDNVTDAHLTAVSALRGETAGARDVAGQALDPSDSAWAVPRALGSALPVITDLRRTASSAHEYPGSGSGLGAAMLRTVRVHEYVDQMCRRYAGDGD